MEGHYVQHSPYTDKMWLYYLNLFLKRLGHRTKVELLMKVYFLQTDTQYYPQYLHQHSNIKHTHTVPGHSDGAVSL